MNFKFKKNEIVLISVLGILIFGFVFYKFIWTPVVPEIGVQKDTIAKLETEKKQLDLDLSNIESKQIELVSKKAGDERLEGYLNNQANIIDCIEYIDKLAKVIGKDISKVNISEPELKEVNKSKYYKIQMDFTTVIDINNIKDLLGYIENSSKLMDISSFKLATPKIDKLKATALKTEKSNTVALNTQTSKTETNVAAIPSDKRFEATLSLNMYSLNLEAADNIYEYSRHKFNRYDYANLSPFVGGVVDLNSILPEDKVAIPEDIIANSSNTNGNANPKDIEIRYNSFLSAGENFMVLGYDKSNDKMMVKTNKYITMEMSIGNTSCTVKATDSDGKTYNMSGSVPNRDLDMFIDVNLSDIKENQDIGLKLKMINNSDNKLNIAFNDKTRKVTVTDRNGTVINSGSDKEKVIIK